MEQFIDRAKAIKVKRSMKSPKIIGMLAETFKAMGDPTRTRIIQALSIEELCVSDLALIVGVTHSAVSHQLRVLRNLHLVKTRRDGKQTFYQLDDHHIKNLFDEGIRHVEEL